MSIPKTWDWTYIWKWTSIFGLEIYLGMAIDLDGHRFGIGQ
jgi:hypothetical protein